VAETFLVLRSNDTSPQLFFHNGFTIDSSGLGSLPGASLEDLTALGGVRDNVKQNNRVFTFLDMIFVIQDGVIYRSTDEATTFASDFTFTGTTDDWYPQVIGPVPVMVQGAIKLVGFYMSGVNIFVFEYDLAGDTWSDSDTTVDVTTGTAGQTVPVVSNNLVYVRIGDMFIAYDPSSGGTITLSSSLSNEGADQMVLWNGGLWLGPITDGAPAHAGIATLDGASWDVDTNGADLGVGASDFPSTSSKAGLFVDPNTNNLIVMWTSDAGNFFVHSITPGLVVTDLTGTVAGSSLTTLGTFGANTRFWPHVTRQPGGTYGVFIYAARGPTPSDPIEKFEWVDDATQIIEHGVVGGSGDMAFPYAIHGGDYNGFFVDEKRVLQTAQSVNPSGITVTCQVYQNGGTVLSVRGHHDNVQANVNNLTLDPMTILNPAGDPGLSLGGSNPGAQVDNVPADKTPITFDWDQIADGFVTGDTYNYQLEAF